jgi:hypothetical protein
MPLLENLEFLGVELLLDIDLHGLIWFACETLFALYLSIVSPY